MTVYGSELLDFPTALSCVDVFFAQSFLIRMHFLRRYFLSFCYSFYLHTSFKIQIRIFLQLIFLQLSLFLQSLHCSVKNVINLKKKQLTPQIFQLMPTVQLQIKHILSTPNHSEGQQACKNSFN